MHVYGVVQFIAQEAMLLDRNLLPIRTSARENNSREVMMDNLPNGWPQKTQERDVGIYQHLILANFEVVNNCSSFLRFVAVCVEDRRRRLYNLSGLVRLWS